MLAAVSPLSSDNDEMQQNQLEMCFKNYGGGGGEEEFLDFSGGNLLDSIDFDDFFVGINDEEDVLPDLEMDPEILAEFSVNINGGDDSQTTTTSVSMEILEENIRSSNEEDADKGNMSSEFSSDSTNFTQGDLQQDVRSKRDEQSNLASKSAAKKGVEKRKSSEQSSRHAHAKRKVKVDWTPELHKRFVQAVEQLGVDKAVPSRILELMGIDCLTRHNIASHLQKYRSHRKNLLAREAEATNWTQKRQLYCAPAGGKRVLMNPWHAPTIGFPPPMTAPAPAPTPQMIPHFRPLHVWGHPSINQSSMLHHVWPKHYGPPAPPPLQPLTWAPNLFSHPPPTLSPSDPSFWHSQQLHRFSSPPVPGVPAAPAGRAIPQPPLDFQPSKESIDAAMGDVISKPWLPLPLGLKPPCVDGVLVELQRQGIPKIPPATVQFDDISCSNFTRLC